MLTYLLLEQLRPCVEVLTLRRVLVLMLFDFDFDVKHVVKFINSLLIDYETSFDFLRSANMSSGWAYAAGPYIFVIHFMLFLCFLVFNRIQNLVE
jgi:hypothetical protein